MLKYDCSSYLQAHHAHLRYEELDTAMGQDILLGYPGGLRQSQVILSYSDQQYLIHRLRDEAGFSLPDHFHLHPAKNLDILTVTNVNKPHIVTCLHALISLKIREVCCIVEYTMSNMSHLLKQVQHLLRQLEY